MLSLTWSTLINSCVPEQATSLCSSLKGALELHGQALMRGLVILDLQSRKLSSPVKWTLEGRHPRVSHYFVIKEKLALWFLLYEKPCYSTDMSEFAI